MSTESPKALLQAWHVDQLTVERATGQTLQHLVALYAEIETAKERRTQFHQALEAGSVNLANLKLEVGRLATRLETVIAKQQQLQAQFERLLTQLDIPPTQLT